MERNSEMDEKVNFSQNQSSQNQHGIIDGSSEDRKIMSEICHSLEEPEKNHSSALQSVPDVGVSEKIVEVFIKTEVESDDMYNEGMECDEERVQPETVFVKVEPPNYMSQSEDDFEKGDQSNDDNCCRPESPLFSKSNDTLATDSKKEQEGCKINDLEEECSGGDNNSCDPGRSSTSVKTDLVVTSELGRPPPHNSKILRNCTECDYKTYNSGNLKKHSFKHSGEKPIACTQCSYKTFHRSRLKFHAKIHSDDKPLACTVCDYKTSVTAHLKRHSLTHSGEKPFACTQCSYKTNEQSRLNFHAKIHSDVKPYSCTVCDYKTSNNNHLKRHLHKHSEDKPHVCTECDYKTANIILMKRHALKHSGEKHFTCTECEYKTHNVSHMKTHSRKHTGEKPFACAQCGYTTSNKTSLRRHSHTHSGEKPFGCFHCDYKTYDRGNLKKHKQRIHCAENP